jgi:hypothetical protein
MKLFQIEEPDGTPQDADGPGAAVGIDLAGDGGAVAIAVGGNAEILPGSDGARFLAAVLLAGGRFEAAAVAQLLLDLRARAERQLARPVTHAVIAATAQDDDARTLIIAAAQASGLQLLRLIDRQEAAARAGSVPAAEAAALGAAILAEDAASAQS